MFMALACGGGGGGDDDGGGSGDAAVRLEQVASLSFPLDLTTAPGDPTRMFVAEKGGRIRVIRDGTLLGTPFLDISGLVSDGGEQGLLGITFHPSYAQNGRFFVDYTDTNGNTRVVGYRVSGNPDVADAASASQILFIEHPFPNHNAGQLAFGPDGFLYIAHGDGGGANDPSSNGQDTTDLLGSLLRIDIDSAAPYAIPPSNPFVGTPGARGELWNIGLRNPFRFSFDRANGDLYIADVGQAAREEVNVAPAGQGGQNYGWDILEGSLCVGGGSCDQSGLTPPVLEYDHSGGACTIIGGYVYRGSAIPEIRGHYFYGDLCARFVKSFRFDGGASNQRDWPTLSPSDGILSFGQDAAGELYVLTSAAVFRIAPQ